ncbi:MAG TPA: DUF4259 domain-containing protein [Polyangiaceae bacterium LLY-WYZ-15_(1-7)]|nr:hypothetical protein [Myxococcales bacterium]MAT23989.1 hypothetical protein [Sandaracinus sp.]HJL00408.1 DUF4259 domain-containing protein [Polyangiaceae bacterium LLY-WYZ-15_(1-7)]HJL11009.1 DUF4259 domain-containing protein [Polyangiaceae bacterium LLY-WYZ-15_(1-7)]HJL22611.1 DUF4259 domain-containing protein [Polyangiaceae bacterium LLY-WYZ-15_(1-7)]|tara:strand:+ start:276 stop:692 length:417 start_codon:yes stop_codon:yes gene_type:complete
MAFDGPTPFDGDPVYMYLDEVEWDQPDDVVRAIREAFEQTREEPYVEVDEGVWAWAAAEMVAIALGRPPKEAPPEPWGPAAERLGKSRAEQLKTAALAALEVVVDDERSEIAELWNERDDAPQFAEHVAPLRARLGRR